VFILQLVDESLSILLPMDLLQVIHINMLLKVVNVGILFNKNAIEPFKFTLFSILDFSLCQLGFKCDCEFKGVLSSVEQVY